MRLSLRAGDRLVCIDGPVLAASAAGPVVELPEGWSITPGLVDLQINGLGELFPLEDPACLPSLDARLAAAGVTSWLCAVPSAERAAVAALADAVAAYRDGEDTGLLGLHLEGPVLSPAHAGAHPLEHLRAGDGRDARALLDLPGVRMVTVAPEVVGARTYAAEAIERGIVVAAGHTGATYEQALEAIDAGIDVATHLFNAMAPLHQRAPGVALAYLLHERTRVALIADGVHLHAAIVALALRVAGPRAFLVSDAAPGAGAAARQSPAGVLAGSAATLADGVRRIAIAHGRGIDEAARMASAVPAALLGAVDRATLAPGARADLALWDARLDVAGCIRAGVLAHATAELHALLERGPRSPRRRGR